VVAALRQRHLPDHVLKVALGDSGQAAGVCEGFSGRKLRVVTPAVAMPAGIVTLLRAPLWVPSPC
jgi:hypothetical protein